jgi:pimeloyl-ACP methyl ester carboxylesterase
VVACVAITANSFFAAEVLMHHRSSRPSVTPADSGLAYDVVPLQASDGTLLEAWWIRPRDGHRRWDLATVILAHPADGELPGAPTGKAAMLPEAQFLSRAGFIVLVPDFRSFGGSQGTRSTGGLQEIQDLKAAVRLAKERVPDSPIAFFGRGMGATAVMLLAKQDMLPTVVADSPYKTWQEAVRRADAPLWCRFSIPALVDRRLAQRLKAPAALKRSDTLAQTRRMGLTYVLTIFGDDPGDSRGLRSKPMWQVLSFPRNGRLQVENSSRAAYDSTVAAFLDTGATMARL